MGKKWNEGESALRSPLIFVSAIQAVLVPASPASSLLLKHKFSDSVGSDVWPAGVGSSLFKLSFLPKL